MNGSIPMYALSGCNASSRVAPQERKPVPALLLSNVGFLLFKGQNTVSARSLLIGGYKDL